MKLFRLKEARALPANLLTKPHSSLHQFHFITDADAVDESTVKCGAPGSSIFIISTSTDFLNLPLSPDDGKTIGPVDGHFGHFR